MNIEKFYFSPNYGIKEVCQMLNIHTIKRHNDNKPIEITTTISPLNNSNKL